jgi:hypothetical protein
VCRLVRRPDQAVVAERRIQGEDGSDKGDKNDGGSEQMTLTHEIPKKMIKTVNGQWSMVNAQP